MLVYFSFLPDSKFCFWGYFIYSSKNNPQYYKNNKIKSNQSYYNFSFIFCQSEYKSTDIHNVLIISTSKIQTPRIFSNFFLNSYVLFSHFNYNNIRLLMLIFFANNNNNNKMQVRKEKLGDRITALHQLVSPFGKVKSPHLIFIYILALQLPKKTTSK